MSTKQIFRSGLMATAGLATLGLTACVNSHASSARYGASTHYDYEGVTCGSACGVSTAPTYHASAATYQAPATTYHATPSFSATHYDYEGKPCSTGCAPSYGTGVISSGVVSSHTSHISTPTYGTETAPCPAGTTSQPDGTCLQGGSYSHYSSGSTISSGSSYSSTYSSGSLSGSVAECPAGTTAQPDGSCLQHGGGYSSYSSTTYTAPVTSTYTGTTSTYVAPELTTECCAPVSSTTTYTGPAATGTYSGYATSGSTYSSSDYLPIRK
jgi:hypothetical protein